MLRRGGTTLFALEGQNRGSPITDECDQLKRRHQKGCVKASRNPLNLLLVAFLSKIGPEFDFLTVGVKYYGHMMISEPPDGG